MNQSLIQCFDRFIGAGKDITLLVLAGIALLILLPRLVITGLIRYDRLETNYCGKRIPVSYGLVAVVWFAIMLVLSGWLMPRERAEFTNWFVACVGFGLLGFIDDIWGTKQIKGLKGHFRALFLNGTVTTGLVKAVGGGILALWLGQRIEASNFLLILLNGGVIALCANAINLLDLRPGRAGAVFLACSVPLVVAAPHSLPLPLVLIPTFCVWLQDSRGKVMMGDAGSNMLGAVMGLAIVTEAPNSLKVLILSALIALHIAAERYSITATIQNSWLLRRLDSLTGVRS